MKSNRKERVKSFIYKLASLLSSLVSLAPSAEDD